MSRATYVIADVGRTFVHLVDQDLGMTVTNDAEAVVAEIFRAHGPKRIFWTDTDGDLGELVHDRGRFISFAPADGVPRE